MTMPTHGCHNCANTHSSCGCSTAHAARTLTASAQPIVTPTIVYPLACTCGTFDPDELTSPTLTASVATVTASDGPYPAGMPVEVGELLLDGTEGHAFAATYRATMARHAADCPVYETMAAVARGVLPAAQLRSLRRYGPVAEAVATSRSDVLVAAALGKMIEIVEAPSTPGPASDPHGVLDLPGNDYDLIPSLIREVGTAYAAGDWLRGTRAANTLREQLRQKAIRTGQLHDDGLVASAAPPRPGHDRMLTAMLRELEHQNERGNIVASASVARQIIDRTDRNEVGHAASYVAAGIAQAEAAANTPPPPASLDLAGLDPATRRALHALVAAHRANDGLGIQRGERDLHRANRDARTVVRAFDQLEAQRFADRPEELAQRRAARKTKPATG